jgi:predicted transcriptional regulator
MTYKTGSIGEFMKWTKLIVADPSMAARTPKRWFDSDKTAAKALGATTSPEAIVKLLSEENLALLQLIATKRPDSVRELSELTKRKESNLSRTLKKLQEAGIVRLEKGPGRTRAPRLAARRVTLDLDLAGGPSIVSVKRPATR